MSKKKVTPIFYIPKGIQKTIAISPKPIFAFFNSTYCWSALVTCSALSRAVFTCHWVWAWGHLTRGHPVNGPPSKSCLMRKKTYPMNRITWWVLGSLLGIHPSKGCIEKLRATYWLRLIIMNRVIKTASQMHEAPRIVVHCCPLLTICPRCCPRHAPDDAPDIH